jgi:hypothetical protein
MEIWLGSKPVPCPGCGKTSIAVHISQGGDWCDCWRCNFEAHGLIVHEGQNPSQVPYVSKPWVPKGGKPNGQVRTLRQKRRGERGRALFFLYQAHRKGNQG